MTRFKKKDSYIEAHQVPARNDAEGQAKFLAWCQLFDIPAWQHTTTGDALLVPTPMGNHKRAELGDWIVHSGGGSATVFTHDALTYLYDLAEEEENVKED